MVIKLNTFIKTNMQIFYISNYILLIEFMFYLFYKSYKKLVIKTIIDRTQKQQLILNFFIDFVDLVQFNIISCFNIVKNLQTEKFKSLLHSSFGNYLYISLCNIIHRSFINFFNYIYLFNCRFIYNLFKLYFNSEDSCFYLRWFI